MVPLDAPDPAGTRDRSAREGRGNARRRGEAGDVDPRRRARAARDRHGDAVDGGAPVLDLDGERLDLRGRVPGAGGEVETLRERRRVGARDRLGNGGRVVVVRPGDRGRAGEVLEVQRWGRKREDRLRGQQAGGDRGDAQGRRARPPGRRPARLARTPPRSCKARPSRRGRPGWES